MRLVVKGKRRTPSTGHKGLQNEHWETTQRGMQWSRAQIFTKKLNSNSSFELILELEWTTLEMCHAEGVTLRLLAWVKNGSII